MANELVIHYPTGATLYALLFDATGQIYNGSTFGAPSSASWTDYDIAMAEVATATGIYRASMPAVAAGAYGWVVRRQAGASPAVADIAVGSGTIRWTGTAEEAVPAAVNVTMSAGVALGGRLAEVTDLPSQPLDATATQAAAAAAIGAYDPPTKAELDAGLLALVGADGDTLETLSDQLDGIPTTGAAGAGAIAHTITVDDGVNPLDGAEVWISTDEAGANVVAGTLSTDALGQVTFMLDAGSYWMHVQLAGYNFTATAFTVA